MGSFGSRQVPNTAADMDCLQLLAAACQIFAPWTTASSVAIKTADNTLEALVKPMLCWRD